MVDVDDRLQRRRRSVAAANHVLQGLKRLAVALVTVLVAALATSGPWAGRSWNVHAAEPARQPNIVLVLMDDMGWRDVGFMGNSFVETPNLDRLAQRGLVFSQAYASAPNCAPTRACLMSGQYTPRHGIYTVVDPRQPAGSPWMKLKSADSESELATEVSTIAESLRDSGYATSFYGMWNLGRGRKGPRTPGGQGFDHVVFPENIGFGKDAYFDDRGNYLSDRLMDEVLQFMSKNRAKPFFVYLADHAVHAPYEPKPDLVKKYEQKAAKKGDRRDDPSYAATIEAVDHNIGRLMTALNELKLADDTVVIFTSDNGGTNQYTAPLRGGKGQLYEGGVRVPLLVWWSKLKKPATRCDVPVASIDLYPTLLDIAGAKPPADQKLDGTSLLPLLNGGAKLDRERLFWHFPCYVGRSPPSSSIREGRYKLIEFFEDGGRRELYDLQTDPGEETDLSKAQPQRAADLYRKLQAWQKETGAMLPTEANPAYDPNASRPRGGPNNSANPNKGGNNKGGNNKGGNKKGGNKGENNGDG